MAFTVTCSTANGLYQGGFRTEEAFLVCIQDCYKGDLRDVKAFSKQVDTYQYIEYIKTHIPDDLCTLQCINIRVKVTYTDPHILHILGKILCHPFGQGCDQDLMLLFYLFIHFSDQVIDLAFYRTYLYFRIQKAGRTDELFCTKKFMICFVFTRSSRYKQNLIQLLLKFIKA